MTDYSRREFLKSMGAVAVVSSVAMLPKFAPAAEEFKGNPDRFGVLVDTTLCIGLNCRRCEIACARENDLPTIEQPPEDPTVFNSPRRTHPNQYTVVNRFENPKDKSLPVYVKKQCMHCDEPACASSCLVNAYTKTPEGAVTYDASVCIGCRYCLVACPFDIPTYEYDQPIKPRVRKCTLCYTTRTSHGQRPACVEACPREVMTFGKRSELLKLAHQKIDQHPERYVDHVYGEHEVGGTSWMYLSPVPFEDIGMRTDLGTTPYPELTRGYLSAAPLILSIWPVFFMGVYMFSKHRQELEDIEHDNKPREGKE